MNHSNCPAVQSNLSESKIMSTFKEGSATEYKYGSTLSYNRPMCCSMASGYVSSMANMNNTSRLPEDLGHGTKGYLPSRPYGVSSSEATSYQTSDASRTTSPTATTPRTANHAYFREVLRHNASSPQRTPPRSPAQRPTQDDSNHNEPRGCSRGSNRAFWKNTSFRKNLDDFEQKYNNSLSVDELVTVIKNLPNETPVFEAVSRSLYFFESRGLAALLKELNKAGLAQRALELFEKLNSLHDHPLADLCDVYTYTTIVSLCSGRQQVKMAVSYIDQMRLRGIECNVHTYSALMNICIKANELDMALDTFDQIKANNLTPNLVTFNILIEVYGKKGDWKGAVQVLDQLQELNIYPEVRTYNIIMNACSKCLQPEEALAVYKRMIANNVSPSATTFTALIAAYGKVGKVDDALEVFQTMLKENCERNVITYSSFIGACEKAGKWSLALEAYILMQEDNVKPNTVTFNSLISACNQGKRPELATELFLSMPKCQSKPDLTTYNNLLAAYYNNLRPEKFLELYREMQSSGFRSEQSVFNMLLDVLLCMGSESAILFAFQVYHICSQRGQFRFVTSGPHEQITSAYTPGAATLVVLQWLYNLKGKYASQNDYQIISTKNLGSMVRRTDEHYRERDDLVSEVLNINVAIAKQIKFEPSAEKIQAACEALLGSLETPFKVRFSGRVISVQITFPRNYSWHIPFLNAFIRSMSYSVKPLKTLEDVISRDMVVQRRFLEIMAVEDENMFSCQQPLNYLFEQRSLAANNILKVTQKMHVDLDVVFDSLILIDKIIHTSHCNLLDNQYMLVAIVQTGIRLRCRKLSEMKKVLVCEEPLQQPLSDAALIQFFGVVGKNEIREFERKLCCEIFSSEFDFLSSQDLLLMYFEVLGLNTEEEIIECANKMLLNSITTPTLMNFSPSNVAAAVLYVSRKKLGLYPFLPIAISDHLGTPLGEKPEVISAISIIEDVFVPYIG